jgi:hypothetical protein
MRLSPGAAASACSTPSLSVAYTVPIALTV